MTITTKSVNAFIINMMVVRVEGTNLIQAFLTPTCTTRVLLSQVQVSIFPEFYSPTRATEGIYFLARVC